MTAFYFSYNELRKQHCDTVTEGRDMLSDIEDNGAGFAIGVYDTEADVVYLCDFGNIIGKKPDHVRAKMLEELKVAGIEPKNIYPL